MISLTSAAEHLTAWEPLTPHLSSDLLSAMEELRDYSERQFPRLSIFAAQPSLLTDWKAAASGVFPSSWELRAGVLPEAAESVGRERIAEFCCDAVVLVTPALHMDSAGLWALVDRLRLFGPPVHLVLTRFHQLPPGENVVRRKKEEAARRLDLPLVQVLACSGQPGPGLLSLAAAAAEIRAAIEEGVPAVRPRQVTVLAARLDERARSEIREHREVLRKKLEYLRAETAIARSATRGFLALSKTLGEAFHRWRSGFVERVASLSWGDVRQRVELAAQGAGRSEQWSDTFRHVLTECITERWKLLEATQPFDLVKRLDALIADVRRAFEKNGASLMRGPFDLFSQELVRLQRNVAEEEPFRLLRERCRELIRDWQPLSPLDIDLVLQQECRGLELVLANHLGKNLTPPAREGSMGRAESPWPEPPPSRPMVGGAASVAADGRVMPPAPPDPRLAHLRQWVHDHTVDSLRDQVAEATVGSVLARLHDLVGKRVEEQRKVLIDEDLPEALGRYLDSCLDVYETLDRELRNRMDALALLLPEQR